MIRGPIAAAAAWWERSLRSSRQSGADRMERVVVNVDGGARGNPGPAAVAAVATDAAGEVLGERSAYIGETTNNVAEYRALLLGLELARELGATDVEVVGDSELVIKQVSGEYRVKHAGLKPLYLEAMAALRQFPRWQVRAVRREANERADELVNDTLDEALKAGM
jgi:ribonuclease HI